MGLQHRRTNVCVCVFPVSDVQRGSSLPINLLMKCNLPSTSQTSFQWMLRILDSPEGVTAPPSLQVIVVLDVYERYLLFHT